MTRILRHLRSQAVAYLALFVALGGTSYAAINLPAHSVGARQLRTGAVGTNQLKNHSITPIKFGHGFIAGYVRAYAEVNGQGVLVSSRPAASLIGWNPGGRTPGGTIQFNQPFSATCFALATMDGAPWATYVSAQAQSAGAHNGGAVVVNIATPQSTGNTIMSVVNVAVICPQP